MGEVWVARNEATGADVALKLLRRSVAQSAEGKHLEERLRQEARLSAMLSHRSIVKVFDLVEEPDGTLVLVMELLRGETLHRYLDRMGPRPAVEAVAILSPVLVALAHAHELGLVHRDVSPANVFLSVDPDGHVAPKLVDFGIAKRSGAGASPIETAAGDVLGTPRYVAPERIRGSANVDGRADVFSAGVVLYECVAGVSPFAASSAAASLAAVLERTVDPDPSIDPRLWVEIKRAISKQPYERHNTALELATALRAAVGETEAGLEACLQATRPVVEQHIGETEVSVDPGPAVVAQTSASPAGARRRPSAWLVGAAAGVALVITVGALALGRKSQSPAASSPAAISSSPVPSATASVASVAPSASADGVDPSATIAIATSAATATANPSPPSRKRPPSPSRPRPVATTPGF
jgi:serine/threonine-protein kinase